MSVRYSPRATNDLIAIADHLTERNPPAARAVEEAIRKTIDLLGEFSGSGRNADAAPERAGYALGCATPILSSAQPRPMQCSFCIYVMARVRRCGLRICDLRRSVAGVPAECAVSSASPHSLSVVPTLAAVVPANGPARSAAR